MTLSQLIGYIEDRISLLDSPEYREAVDDDMVIRCLLSELRQMLSYATQA